MFQLVTVLSVLCATIAFKIPNHFNQAKIVGGDFAQKNQFPFQVSLRYMGEHSCGGSILSEKYILTAAHCVSFEGGKRIEPISDFSILAGTNVVEGKNGVVRGIKKIRIHEDFGNYKNDLAILELDEPLEFSESIQAIELVSDRVSSGEKVFISGWGLIGNAQDISIKLKFNTLTAMSRKECADEAELDGEEFMCLDHEFNNGACEGDSGGPAVYNGKLAGVSSFIMFQCGDALPDVYVNVSHYVNWIKKHTKT